MKAIAVNGSPRKTWNTATLLQKALDGAKSIGSQTEFIHLYDLDFKGCISCFTCKKKDTGYVGHCAMQDGLTDVLEKVLGCDVLLLGSPIYFGNITGEMHSFLERLLFSNLSYNSASHRSVFQGKLSSGFIYTMNAPEESVKQNNYEAVFHHYRDLLQRLFNGTSEFLLSTDTYQFEDYSKYEVSMFSEKHKSQVRAEQFPIDSQKAFDMGVRLASI